MKKLLAVLLALVMVLSLVACGAAPAETPNTPAEPNPRDGRARRGTRNPGRDRQRVLPQLQARV